MGKYEQDAKQLLPLVGGKENIAAVSHCMTRMRFVLVDDSKADIEAIEACKFVKGSFTQAGQFQVIIGNTVADFYKDFTEVAGIEGVSKDAVKQAAKVNQNPLQRAVGVLAEIFAPLIPAIITGGLILGFRNVIDAMYLFENGTKTLVEVSVFWAGVDSFLWLLGEAIFHMLPVGICWSVTRKMGTTQILGIILGLTLVSGQLLNAYAVAGTAPADIPFWNFGFFKVNMIGYQAQVIPAILAAFTLVYLERFFHKIVPQVLQMILVPFCSLLLSVIAAHFILGPIGWRIGDVVSAVVLAGITGSFKVIFGAIFGFVYAPLVITGLHHMSNAIDMQLIAATGGTPLWPMIALSNIAQGSAVLGMSYLQKKNADAQEVNIPSMISCYLGVTEPAIFGVNLKYSFPFVCGMIGSACAGFVCTLTSTTANAIGVGGIPGILSIQPKYMLTFAICMAIAIVMPFVLTVMIGRNKLTEKDLVGAPLVETTEEAFTDAEADEKFISPMTGHVVSIDQVEDQVFASKAMGDGIAIDLTDGKVYAPLTGKISMVFPTGHAYGMETAGGKEILIHIGMDTVQLEGKGFKSHVNAGDIVHQGDLLVEVDIDYIKSQGKPLVSPIIFTDGSAVEVLKSNVDVVAKEGDIINFK
ncbi:MAG: PTS system trehalose-specific EIIBC component [Erysipelotrichaceae bacterium]|nr:PTS system trehalose-specific EIIBC component [Erysipelotrichaceae bacterium]